MFLIVTLIVAQNSINASAFDWQAHRGGRGIWPENSIPAMMHALEFDVTTLEMDVVISKDKQVVVSHEPWMSAEICLTPNGKPVQDKAVNLYKLDYKEIGTYDCGTKPHPRFPRQKRLFTVKPRLAEVLSTMEKKIAAVKRAIDYSIEIKSTLQEEKAGFQPPYREFTDLVIAEIKKHIPAKRVMIQSFDWRVLQYMHQKYPEFRTVALIEEKYNAKTILQKLGFKPTVFSPDYLLMSKADVDYMHSIGVKVIPWTVNTDADVRKVKAMGVDGIITDYTDLIEPTF